MIRNFEWHHNWKFPCSGLHGLGPTDWTGQGREPVEAFGELTALPAIEN